MALRLVPATMAAFLLMAPAAGAFTAHGSVEQVYVTGAHKGARITLLDRKGHRVARHRVGSLGAVVFRDVKPGKGYRIAGRAKRLRVLPNRSKPPSRRVYDQRIPTSGYGYLTTRDGTKLAVNVHLPSGPGPYPTLFEYAGYGYADPSGPRPGSARSRTCSASRWSTSTCGGPAARAARSTSSSRSRGSTATT